MSGRGRSRPPEASPARGPAARPPEADDVAFERWLREGLAPDEHDHAAGRALAAAWRDRRRAVPAGARGHGGAPARRWAWAPLAVAAVTLVVAVAWPTAPVTVDGEALAHAYLDAMGALPLGDP